MKVTARGTSDPGPEFTRESKPTTILARQGVNTPHTPDTTWSRRMGRTFATRPGSQSWASYALVNGESLVRTAPRQKEKWALYTKGARSVESRWGPAWSSRGDRPTRPPPEAMWAMPRCTIDDFSFFCFSFEPQYRPVLGFIWPRWARRLDTRLPKDFPRPGGVLLKPSTSSFRHEIFGESIQR